VKFGWHIPPFPLADGEGRRFLTDVSNMLDRIQGRFHSAWMDDHMLPWADFVPPDTENLECLTTVSFLSASYPRLSFGCSVLCQSFRNPALVAKMGSTLQVLTGGRFILGMGAGWMESEHLAYGFDFPRPAIRIARLEEAVQIIRRMWTGSPASFDGEHYRIRGAYSGPMPDPPPPIMIGGGGEQLTLRVVARHADWWNLNGGSPELYARKLAVLRRHCEDQGRPEGEILKTWSPEVVAVAEKEEEARRIAAASPYRDEYPVVGTPEQVAEQLRRFTDLGVEYMILRFVDFPSTAGADLFAEAVAPLLG
jgi:alkanesulfonate monooxygenase SsuD/methylene tetrahydromethanopterin reductase-like flavin-dependent oxidoreductase (luciferase family)